MRRSFKETTSLQPFLSSEIYIFGSKNREADKLRTLLKMFADSLPEANLADAEELIAHGEFGEALDLICTQVYEYEIPVSADAYRAIQESGRRMQMEESSWSYLKELCT